MIAVVPIADGAVQVLYKTPYGTLKERLLNRGDLGRMMDMARHLKALHWQVMCFLKPYTPSNSWL